MKTYSTDMLLMVMKSATHAWHLGQHVNLNTTRDFPVHLSFSITSINRVFHREPNSVRSGNFV